MKKQINISLSQLAKTNVFSVPEGYFNSLRDSIKGKILETNPAFKLPVFTLPDQYFEQLPVAILARIQSEKWSVETIKKLPFAVPDSYFESMADKIQKSTSSEDSVFIKGATESFHIPEDYFESLPSKIQERISSKKETRVIPLYERTSFRYAAAACFIAVIAISYLAFFKDSATQKTPMANTIPGNETTVAVTMIANLKKEDITKYLESQENLEVAQLIEYSSPEKKEKIQKELEKDLLNIPLNEVDKKTLEIELNDLDLTDLDAEI